MVSLITSPCDVAAGIDMHVDAPDRPDDSASNQHLFGDDFAMHHALGINNDGVRSDVAVDGAVDLNLPATDQAAFDHHVFGDDGWTGRAAPSAFAVILPAKFPE